MFRRIRQEIKQGRALLAFGFLKAFGMGLGMLAPLVIAKLLSPGLFGSYSLAKMILFFFATLLIASSQTPFIVFANQEMAKTGKINKAFSVQCMFFVLSMVIFGAVVGVFRKYLIAFAGISATEMWFVALAFLGVASKLFLCNLFMALDQKTRNSLAELVYGFLTVALVLVFYSLNWFNLRSVFLTYLISAVVLIVVFLKTIDRRMLLPLRLDRRYLMDMLNFTKWVFVGATAIYFINWGDNLVLRYYVSREDIGIYNLGYQAFKGTLMLLSIVGVYFAPLINQNIDDPGTIRRYLRRKRPVIVACIIICLTGMFVVAPYALHLVYGDTYRGAASIFQILLAAALSMGYLTFYHTIYNAAKRYKFIHIVSIFHVLLNIGLNILLVPSWGIAGAAWGTTLSSLARVVVTELHFRWKMRRALNLSVGRGDKREAQ